MLVAGEAEMASAIITESIPPERRDDSLRWVRGITRAAESVPGYRETNVLPPLEADGRDWITIIHFQTRSELEAWIDSEVRAQWVERFHREFSDFTLHQVQGGLSSWFSQQRLPGWKMALTVLLALYPTVMLISLVIMPWLGRLPLAASMLIGNMISVSALQGILMPRLNRRLAFWLKPAALIDRRSNLLGVLFVVGTILFTLVLFIVLGRWV
jgi:uncharacterized protein